MAIYNFGGGPQDVISDYTGEALGGIALTVWADEALTEQITSLSVLTASGWESASAVTSGTSGHMLGRMRFRVADRLRVWLADHAGGSWVLDAHETMAVAVAEVEGVRDDMIDTANATIASAVATVDGKVDAAIATVDAKRDQIITDATAAGATAGAAAGALTDAKLNAVLQIDGASRATLAGLFEPLAKAPGFDIVLILGQSNASGNGHPVLPTSADLPTESVMMYQTAATAGDAGMIRPASEPVSYRWDGSPGVGPGTEFARRHAATLPPGRRVLIVPLAYGGTSLSTGNKEWGPGGVRRVAALRGAADAIDAANRVGPSRVTHIIWVQGEGDTLGGATQAGYTSALQSLVADFRALPGALDAKLCMGSMVPEWRAARPNQTVHLALNAAPTVIHNSYFTNGPYGQDSETDEAGGFTTQGIHYSAVGARELGRAMWEASIRPPTREAQRYNFFTNPRPASAAGWTAFTPANTTVNYNPGSGGFVAATATASGYLGVLPANVIPAGERDLSIRATVLPSGGADARINVVAFNSANQVVLDSASPATTPADWAAISHSVTLPASTARVEVRIRASGTVPAGAILRVKEASMDGAFFDGATAGAEWMGGANASASVMLAAGATSPLPPPVPVIPQFVPTSDSAMTLKWVTPPGATAMVYQWRVYGASAWTEVAAEPAAWPTLSGLTGALIEARVKARNANGDSGWSPTAIGTPVLAKAIAYVDTIGVGPGHWSAAYNPGGKYPGLNINQPTASQRPFINRDVPGYEFRGGHWWTMGTLPSSSLADGSGAWTVAGVATNRMTGSEPGGIFGWRSQAINYGSIFFRGDGRLTMQAFNSSATPAEATSTEPVGAPVVFVGERSASAVTLWTGGVQRASQASTAFASATAAQAVVGAAYRQDATTGVLQPLTGDIAGLLIFPGVLTAAEKAGVSAYLSRRYMVGGK